MKILICFGTRSEWIKLKPLIKLMDKKEYELFFTGQHPDLLSDIKADYSIQLPKNTPNRLNVIMAKCMLHFPLKDFSAVVVQGGTSSTLGCALAAYNRNIKVIHLEAGLRTENIEESYPEEGYRQMISRISEINFCPTSTSFGHLVSERVEGEGFVVGNTVLDNLTEHESKREYTNKILITLHKRENYRLLDAWFKEIDNIALKNPDLEFIFINHPNPILKKYTSLFTNVTILDPLSHSDLINILLKCKLVITDSNGILEEASYFNKKIIVCKKKLDRPESLYSRHSYICPNPENLLPLFNKLINDYQIQIRCPYGEGRTSSDVYEIIKRAVPHFNKQNNL